MPEALGARRVFSQDDQEAFARLSGDYNPLHMDPLAARRLMFGQQVVHGMHLVLWVLDQCLAGAGKPLELKKLRVEFRRPLLLGQEVGLHFLLTGPEVWELEIEAQGVKLAWLRAEVEASSGQAVEPLPTCPAVGHCRHLDPAKAADDAGELKLALDSKLAHSLWPNLEACLRPDQIATLASTSRLVGMQCPGLHSVYGSLELSSHAYSDPRPMLSYQVARYEPLMSLLLIRVRAAGLQGTIKAFMRPPPRRQASLPQLSPLVEPREFQGSRCLIIGGSRGLGEVAAKLLAVGGAEVALTYARGAKEAQTVADEIASAGGQARVLAWDVLHPPAEVTLALGDWRPNQMAYFATPFIAAGQRGQFSLPAFNQFCAFYLGGFLASLEALLGLGLPDLRVLYPSSVFVEAPPPDMLEYAAAKAAGEEACRQLNRRPGLRVLAPRLPKVATDQTASFLPIDLPEPAPLILEALRMLQDY